MLQLFGYVSGFFSIISIFPYIRDILRLQTKPQRTTWFIYSVLGAISFFSQLAKGATNSLWLPGTITLTVGIIFFLSLKYGVGGFSTKDYLVLGIAALGLIAWYFTKEAAIALYLVILIDASGTYLTIEKTYVHPESETFSSWALASVSALFSLLAVGKVDVVLMSYPLYILLADGAIAATIILGKRNIRKTFGHAP